METEYNRTIPGISIIKRNLSEYYSLLTRARNFLLGGTYAYLVTDNEYFAGHYKTGIAAYHLLWRRWRNGNSLKNYQVYREFDETPPMKEQKAYYVNPEGIRQELKI